MEVFVHMIKSVAGLRKAPFASERHSTPWNYTHLARLLSLLLLPAFINFAFWTGLACFVLAWQISCYDSLLKREREKEKKRHKHWCCHRRECEFVRVLMLKSLLGMLMKCLLSARGEVVLHLMPLPLSVTKDVLRTDTIFTPASFGDRNSSSSSPPPH
jgi:hypothetical protein